MFEKLNKNRLSNKVYNFEMDVDGFQMSNEVHDGFVCK